MKTLLKVMGVATALLISTAGGVFAQDTKDSGTKNPLKNKNNYKASVKQKRDLSTKTYGTLVQKEINRDYKKSKNAKSEMVVSFNDSGRKAKNYKMPH